MKHLIEYKLPKTFLVNIKKNIKKHFKKMDNLTVSSQSICHDGTDTIPLSQTTTLFITCLKCDLKDSPICLDLAYFQPKNKAEK